jgi:hypothetical protein
LPHRVQARGEPNTPMECNDRVIAATTWLLYCNTNTLHRLKEFRLTMYLRNLRIKKKGKAGLAPTSLPKGNELLSVQSVVCYFR